MTATNGHKACALPAAPRQRPEAPPTTTTRSAPKSSPGLLRGSKAVPCSSQTASVRAHANVRPTHRSHAATIAVRPTTTSSAPFRDLNAIAAIPPLTPRRTPQATRFRPAAYALRFAPSPPASSLCFWDPVSPTDQPVLSPLPRTSCLKLPSHPVTPLRSRPHARNGRPAPCPTSTKLTPHGRSCPMPVALFAKTLAVLPASPWSISLRPAIPIRRRSIYARWPKPATTPPLVPPSGRL